MRDEYPELTGAEKEFETALGGLEPAGARELRDRMLFEAGRASVSGRWRPGRFWPAAAAVFALALSAVLVERAVNGPAMAEPEVKVVYVEVPVAREIHVAFERVEPQGRVREAATGMENYVALRERVLAEGLDALPERGSGGGGAAVRAGDALGIGNWPWKGDTL